MKLRLAQKTDMPLLMQLGHSVWAKGRSLEDFTQSSIEKDKTTNRDWLVLVSDDDEVLSSLTIQPLNYDGHFGFGNVVTPEQHRKNGYASQLIKLAIEDYLANKGATAFFLYSEVDPKIYESLGFKILPEQFQNFLPKSSYMCASDMYDQIVNDPDFQPPKDYY
tara:strand:+ start:3524 stop:4015 length:492 start_codon:yes stop_codon:yes gene_type:complete